MRYTRGLTAEERVALVLELSLRRLEASLYLRFGETWPVRAVVAVRRGLFQKDNPRREDREGGELVGVTAPRGPRPSRGGAEAKPPAPERPSVRLPQPQPIKR
jgi:hypothetical protein